jgi:hypothetical protein
MLAGHSSASAQADSRISIDVAPRVGISTNPFLQARSEASAFLQLAVTSRYSVLDELSESTAVARATGTQYLSRYGLISDFGLGLTHRRRVSERLTLTASANLESSVLGSAEERLDFAPRVISPIIPVDVEVDPDLVLAGQRQRRTAINASVGATVNPSDREIISFAVSGNDSHYSGRGFDFTSVAANASYSRRLSSLTQVGVGVSAERVSYEGPDGDSTILQPTLQAKTQLTGAWSLEGTIGASLVESERDGVASNFTSLSASLRSCYNDPRSTFCGGFLRDASATGLGGIRQRTSANASYTYRLSEMSSLGLSASYLRYNATRAGLNGGESWNTEATYRHRLRERLFASASLGYRRVTDQTRSGEDLHVTLNATYRFLDPR